MSFINTLIGRDSTIRVQACLFHKWIAPIVKDPKHTTTEDFIQYILLWQGYDLKPKTIKMIMGLSARYIKWSGGPEIDTRRFRMVLERSEQEETPKALTKKEIGLLTSICAVSNPVLYLAVMISLHTGMRKGEVFGLKWEDVDFIKGVITVKRSYDGKTKNGKTRIIPMSYTLEKILLDFSFNISDNYIGTKVITKQSWEPNPELKAACKKAGIKEITFHALRHTFATLALEAGRSPKLVSSILGHSHLSTTLDMYWSHTGERMDMNFLEEEK